MRAEGQADAGNEEKGERSAPRARRGEARRHQGRRGGAQVDRAHPRLLALEQGQGGAGGEGEVGPTGRKDQLDEGQRMQRPGGRAAGGGPARRAPHDVEGGQPLRGAESQAERRRRRQSGQARPAVRALAGEDGEETHDHDERREGGEVGRSRHHLHGQGCRRPRHRPRRGPRGEPIEGEHDPGQPRRRGEVVPHGDERQKRSARRPHAGRGGGGHGPQPVAPGEAGHACSRQREVGDGEQGVIGGRPEDEVQPRRRIEDLRTRIGEERASQAAVGVP